MNDYRVKTKKRIVAVSFGAAVNLLLFFVKLYIGLSSNSIAIYADSLNSLTDFAVCIVAAVGFYLASSAPDEKYPFGKGRAEDLTELLISAVILTSGGAFAYMSFERILYPVPVWYSSVYAVVIAATAAVKLAMALFFSKASAKLGSDAVKGMATDSVTDFFVTACTFVSFMLVSKTELSLDGFAGLAISLVLIAEGIKMLRTALGKILGKREPSVCNDARKLLEAEFPTITVKDIQHHAYGERGVFTVSVEAEFTADEMKAFCVKANEKTKEIFNSDVYIMFGGKR